MTVSAMRKKIEAAFQTMPGIECTFDSEKSSLRIQWAETKKGVDLALSPVLAKWERRQDAAFDEVVFHIKETLNAMNEIQTLQGKEKHVFPVIRATSFPSETKDGVALVSKPHTAETRIYYALDLGNSYRLIDVPLLKEEGWSEGQLHEMALFNIRSLDTTLKEETVAGNRFSFLNTKDGYDAGRILNESFLEHYASTCAGVMAVAVPHQDVLILADINNDQGYDILGQMGMSFFADGYIPITALPFIYENKELEPIFILAKKRPIQERNEEK
ncbi:DUF1444 domain-containing protein [Aureibacillus halotolerans]